MNGRGRSRPTLDDVADLAGVSRATASRVLNGGIRTANAISAEVREAIHEAARTLDYAANGQAQSMAAGISRTIAVLVTEVDDPGAAELVSGASDTAHAFGYSVVIVMGGFTRSDELEAMRSIRSQRPAALLVAMSRSTDRDRERAFNSELEAFADSGGRVALIGDNSSSFDTISFRNADSAALLADELVSLGYRRFAMVGSPVESLTPGERMRGFTDGLARHGISPVDGMVVEREFDSEGGYRATGQLVDRIDELDVIFAASDAMALGVIARLAEDGLTVPEHVAVAGFDDVPFVRDLTPPLTTVHVPLRHMADLAVRRLLSDSEAASVSEITGTPEIRGSTPPFS